MIASPKEPWIASEAFWWEVKGRTLYSVWLVMKLIHGSLHRVIELLPLNRKLNSCAYSFDSCFAARNCYLQSLHTTKDLCYRIFPAPMERRFPIWSLNSAESAYVEAWPISEWDGVRGPPGLGTSCWLLDLELLAAHAWLLRPLGAPRALLDASVGSSCVLFASTTESLCKVCRVLSPFQRCLLSPIRVLLRAT